MNELLPKFDCGLCGNPVCMALARKILLKTQMPGDCRFISQENLGKIQEIIPKEKIERKHPHPNIDEDIIEIHPCTEDGKVTLETQLKSKALDIDFYSDFFDQIQLCTSLSEVDVFDKVTCSPKMGYGLVEIKGKRVHIFKTGKIIMRRADDDDDALATLSKTSKILLPARICSCGNIIVDCFGGSCENCSKDVCSALLDILNMGIKGNDCNNTILDILEDVNPSIHEKLIVNFKSLGDIVKEVRKIDDELRKGKVIDKESIRNKTDEILTKINKTCMKSILENEGTRSILIALTQYGLGRDLIRARDGLLSSEMKNDEELYKRAMELLFDGYNAFEIRDVKASKVIGEKYKKFISTYNVNSFSVGVAKIATNGFYISRILGISVPDVRKLV